MDDVQTNIPSTPIYNPPTTPPPAPVVNPNTRNNIPERTNIHFTGFWKRVAIYSIDIFIFGIFLGSAAVILPILINIVLYFATGRTMGDFIMQTKLVDALSHEKPSILQLIGRFFAKIISSIPLNLGFYWAGWTREKKAWHDMLSGTRYIETKSYAGGITWIANIALFMLISFVQMQSFKSFLTDTVLPLQQGLHTAEQSFESGEVYSLERALGDPINDRETEVVTPPAETTPIIEQVEAPIVVEKDAGITRSTPRISLTKTEPTGTPDIPKEASSEAIITDTEQEEIPQPIGTSSYTKTKDKVFISGYEIISADPDSFTLFPEDKFEKFGKDKNNTYYKTRIIPNTDLDTFKVLDRGFRAFSKDKERVFFEIAAITNADSDTFEVLDTGTHPFSRDKDRVFFETEELINADRDTFEMLEKYGRPFSRDAARVFFEAQEITNADSPTFETLGGGLSLFARDKERVFFETRELITADRNTFEILEDGTIQDKNNIYTFNGNIKSPR